MPIKDRDPSFDNLENLQEDLVLDSLKRQIVQRQYLGKLCACPTCMVDMAAIALNALPPKYVADRYNKFVEPAPVRGQQQDDVDRAVQTAIRQVMSRPHHRPS